MPMKEPAEDRLLRETYQRLQTIVARSNNMMPHEIMRTLLTACWGGDTAKPSRRADWSERSKACGQDDVTSLVVQTMWGGYIWCSPLKGFPPHHYNVGSNGEGVSTHDMTRWQYPYDAVVYVRGTYGVERETLLADPEVAARYATLRERVQAVMDKELALL